jgi:RNA polymerase sigma-70 factor (ECF subfamily)
VGLDKDSKTVVLVKGALKGSNKALSDLMDLYWEDVLFFLKQKNIGDFLKEDVAVITFTKAFENIESYKIGYSFKNWILAIASNTLIDFLRKKKEGTVSIDEIFTDSAGNTFTLDFKSGALSPEEVLIESQEQAIVLALINSVPSTYSEILKLRFIDHLSYKEISQNADLPMNVVKVRLLRGRKMLVELLEKQQI